MTHDTFWSIIACACAISKVPTQKFDALKMELLTLSQKDMISFHQIYRIYYDKLYRYDIWGAASAIYGTVSDDSYSDFRSCIIAAGRSVCEDIIKDPDLLACHLSSFPGVDSMFYENYGYAIYDAYEQKFHSGHLETLDAMPSHLKGDPEDLTHPIWPRDIKYVPLVMGLTDLLDYAIKARLKRFPSI